MGQGGCLVNKVFKSKNGDPSLDPWQPCNMLGAMEHACSTSTGDKEITGTSWLASLAE